MADEGGIEVIPWVQAVNAWMDLYGMDEDDQPLRDGIPLGVWRALPDSPGGG
jgi:hypothetical protein